MPYKGNLVKFGSSGRVGPTYLTHEEAARAFRAIGFPVPDALAVFFEESWLSPDAEGDLKRVGERTSTGEHWGPAIGITQIRTLQEHSGTGSDRDIDKLRGNADAQIAAGYRLWKSEGWRPWAAQTSGRYRKHLPWAKDIYAQLEGAPVARSVKSLLKLLSEINALAPNRNKASDGWIGDPAHASRHSDHNPEPDGTVDARDFTHDPVHGADMHKIAAQVVANKDPRVSYLIWNRRICSGNRGPSPWVWRPYGGSNPHDKHLHVSVLDVNQDDESPWLDNEEDVLAGVTKEEFDDLKRKVDLIYKDHFESGGSEHTGVLEEEWPPLVALVKRIAAKVGA